MSNEVTCRGELYLSLWNVLANIPSEICNKELKSITHALFYCPYMTEVWMASKLDIRALALGVLKLPICYFIASNHTKKHALPGCLFLKKFTHML